MKTKKKILGSIILLLPFVTFANTVKNNLQDSVAALDIPLIDGMSYFYNTIFTFAYIAGILAIFLGMLGILWNAFRLWFGTQQVRKAAIDILTKFLLFTFISAIYGSIIWGVLETSTRIGLYSGNGLAKMEGSIQQLYTSTLAKVDAGSKMVEELFQSADKNAFLSDTNIKALAKGAGMTDDQVKSLAAKYNIRITSRDWVSSALGLVGNAGGALGGAAAGAALGSVVPGLGTIAGGIIGGILGGVGGTIAGNKAGNIYAEKPINKLYQKIELSQVNEIKNAIKQKSGEKAILLLHAITEAVGGQIDDITVDGVTLPATTKAELPSLVDKYIKSISKSISFGKHKTLTLVSPSSMLKVSIMIANIIKGIGETSYDSSKNVIGLATFNATVQNISRFIIMWVLIIAVIAATCFFCIQYAMTLFEYFITTSMGIIFIPFILWDGTKSFAAKLVTLFTSYFIKLTVMLLCVVWAESILLDCCMTMLSTTNLLSMSSAVSIIFTVLLTFIVTQNAPQVALTVLNGTPQLSMGEFLHAAGTAVAGAVLAKKAAGVTGRATQQFGTGVVDAGAAGLGAGVDAFKSTNGSIGKKIGAALGQGAAASTIQGAKAFSSGIINTPATFLGMKPIISDKKNSVGTGKGYNHDKYDNKDNSMTTKNVFEHYRDLREENKNKKTAQNAAPIKAPESDKKVSEEGAGTRT